LQSILFFIPNGAYREMFWPKTWVESSRILRQLDGIAELRQVAASKTPHYLSALGAIVLANRGFRGDDVEIWLKNERDYYLLTSEERSELRNLLSNEEI